MKRTFCVLLAFAMILSVGSANGKGDNASGSGAVKTVQKAAPPEGADTNQGRPYNLGPVKYDSRDDKYLTGINGTILPIVEDDFTIEVWRDFSSTVMQGMDECLAVQELEDITGVKVKWVYPPVGQKEDNFNLRVSSNDLPHVFSNPPAYPGGYSKAIDDEVYIDLTPYYDAGLMPNIQWLRENRADINRDIVDDMGRIFSFPMLDIVPTDPWSGLWIREDLVKKQGMELPETIDEWDAVLHKIHDAYGVTLSLNLKDWYGVATNYMFAASYETAYEFFHKDGDAKYGPIESGYKDFLTLMNSWYEDGLIDPDFATRDFASYTANMANGTYGAMGMAYGDVGQAKVTGMSIDPDYKLTPLPMPTSYAGQVIHMHQDNSTVRSDRDVVTVRALDEDIVEPIVRWKDYQYSQDGGDLLAYGPEGVSYEWEPDGSYKWIFPRLKNDEGLDFWTIYPLFKIHNIGSLRNSAAYEFEPEVYECIELWDSQDSSWIMPDNISHTVEESRELANIMTDINTYRDEMTLKFIVGQEPLDNFDDFVATIKKMNIDRALEIKSAALERYFNR